MVLPEPIPYKGSLMLFEVPEDVLGLGRSGFAAEGTPVVPILRSLRGQP